MFFNTNNLAGIQVLSATGFSFNILSLWILIASLQKSVSSSTVGVFVLLENYFLLENDRNMTRHNIIKDQLINISPVRNIISKIRDALFELMQIEKQCCKNYFKNFFNMKLVLQTRKLIWDNKSHTQSQQKII